MSDRELLELAAKAAGWTGWRSKHGYWNLKSPEGEDSTQCHHWDAYCPNTGKSLLEPTFADAIAATNWNPLIDDGDALRLAVRLGLDVCIDKPPVVGEPYTQAIGFIGDGKEIEDAVELHNGDSYAATRRAIVRAAAEIGKSM